MISGKFEIQSRVPGIIAVRSEYWIIRLEGKGRASKGLLDANLLDPNALDERLQCL